MKRLKFLLIFILLISQAFFKVYGQDVIIKVACIGNSITYGSELDSDPDLRKLKSYPYKLENLLNQHYSGKTFKVTNYAVPGTTMLKDPNDGGDPKLDEKQWSYWEADDDPGSDVAGGKAQYDLALADIPDIVVIKFGTNDARGENWRASEFYGKKNFYDNYVEFINSFRILNPNVKVYISYPLPVFRSGSFYITQARVIRNEIIPFIKQIARKNNATIIDLHSAFYDGYNRGLILEKNLAGKDDYIHPTAEGATLIAQEVFNMIKMTYKP